MGDTNKRMNPQIFDEVLGFFDAIKRRFSICISTYTIGWISKLSIRTRRSKKLEIILCTEHLKRFVSREMLPNY
jgi:hypothetical protein